MGRNAQEKIPTGKVRSLQKMTHTKESTFLLILVEKWSPWLYFYCSLGPESPSSALQKPQGISPGDLDW